MASIPLVVTYLQGWQRKGNKRIGCKVEESGDALSSASDCQAEDLRDQEPGDGAEGELDKSGGEERSGSRHEKRGAARRRIGNNRCSKAMTSRSLIPICNKIPSYL